MNTLIVYGNCQAEAISTILDMDPAARTRFRIKYLRSYEHPRDGWDELSPNDASRCRVLFEQHDQRAFPRASLPDDCVALRFPAVDFNLLWPFTVPNPFDRADDEFPFGRFPYGDRIIIGMIERNCPFDEIKSYYLDAWNEYMPNLDHLLELETARLAARDEQCDVRMGSYVLQHFRSDRLFWTANHPTASLLGALMRNLIGSARERCPGLGALDPLGTLRRRFSREGPLGIIGVPVHPKVAEHFGLEWYDPNERYRVYGSASLTYEEYVDAHIRWSLEVKASREPELSGSA